MPERWRIFGSIHYLEALFESICTERKLFKTVLETARLFIPPFRCRVEI